LLCKCFQCGSTNYKLLHQEKDHQIKTNKVTNKTKLSYHKNDIQMYLVKVVLHVKHNKLQKTLLNAALTTLALTIVALSLQQTTN